MIRRPLPSAARGPGLRARARRDRGGIAILVVIATLMFLTVLVTDVTYGARVRYLTAAHERDEAKAYWLAQTGVNVYRLLLTANKQLASNSSVSSMLEMAGIAAGDALWQMVPFISTGLLRMFSGGDNVDDEELQDFAQTGQVSEEVEEESREGTGSRFGNRNFLDFDGDFNAEVKGEDCRFNVNQLANVATGTNVQESAVGQQIYGLLSGEENEAFLRERNLERWDLVYNLLDWVDADTNVSSGRGGYEDEFYNSLPSPYLSKNAKFDTQEEIRLVQGWQDDVYERFGAQLTINGSGKVNVNCADDDAIKGLLRTYWTRAYSDDELDQIVEQLRTYQAMSAFKKPTEFVNQLKNGSPAYEGKNDLANAISTSTTMFTITSTGQVGDATVRITAVVDYASSDEGSIVYWRVD